jgi:hypothetical protein
MRMRTVFLVTITGLCMESASAADLAPIPWVEPPAGSAAAYSWTGAYIGAHLGTGYVEDGYNNPLGAAARTGTLYGTSLKAGTGFVGLQGGFSWQAPNSNWVLGLEASISATDARASNTCLTADGFITSANCGNSLHSVGSVVGRGGLAFGVDNRFLAYGKAGIGYVNLNTTQMTNYDGGTPGLTVRSLNDRALVLGGGLEYALSHAFSVSLDYTHYGLQSYQLPTSYAANGQRLSMTFKPTYDVVRLGVNYHMGAEAGPLGSDPALVSAAASLLTFEIGMRYWYSIGKFQKDLANDGTNSTSLVSRLTYQNKSSSGEIFGSIKGDNAFLRGSVSDGRLMTAKLNDEDWLGATVPYSNTLSSAKGGMTAVVVDFGYDMLRGQSAKLSPFVGYSFLYEQHKGYGCTQQTALQAICAPGDVAPGTLAITETDYWHGLRLGLTGEFALTDQLHLTTDVAYLPLVAMTGTDNHWLRNLVIKEFGRGQGAEAQTMLTYDITRQFSVGAGLRYWSLWANNGKDTFNGVGTGRKVAYRTEQAGAFLQASWKFGGL